MSEKYNLIWHTYTDHLQKMLREMKEFTDVTLICDDKQKIRAHRNILASCSPVFKSIFQIEDVQNPIIFLRGINHVDMESILHFIYFGEASFYQERMDEFLRAAKSLEIEELSNVAPESPNSDTEQFVEQSGVWSENHIEEELDEFVTEEKTRTISKSIRDNGGTFRCPECEKEFCQSGTLNRHVKAVHGGIKYKCKQCPKEFTRRGPLNAHVKVIHEMHGKAY